MGEDILVVEDNAANVKLVTFLLSKRGYAVRVATDAESALSAIEASTPKLILMDVQLPGQNGLDLTRRLKSDPRFSHVPIIAVTAFAMKGDAERAREAGCDDYVTKPIDTRALANLVATYFARKAEAAPET